MKIIEPQKTVDYFGVKLVVPNDGGWLATDKDGEVYFYEIEPVKMLAHWDAKMSDWDKDNGTAYLICTVHLDGMDWIDTLMEVKL